MGRNIALAHIEHEGHEYNWGDEVPDKVAEAHPGAVGVSPLSEGEVDDMSEEEARDRLKSMARTTVLTGEAARAHLAAPDGNPTEVAE